MILAGHVLNPVVIQADSEPSAVSDGDPANLSFEFEEQPFNYDFDCDEPIPEEMPDEPDTEDQQKPLRSNTRYPLRPRVRGPSRLVNSTFGSSLGQAALRAESDVAEQGMD